ncbi:hypothetical protein V3N95_07565 [Micrococcaceae bacterium Sec6.3]
MLYRVRPNNQVSYWCPQPGEVPSFPASDADPDSLNWEPTHTYFNAVLAVALRHGAPTPTGLIVSSSIAADLIRPIALRQMQDKVVAQLATPHMRTMQSAINALMGPGWTKLGEKTTADSDQAAEDAIAAAEDSAMQWLAAPMRADLVAHWTDLGGKLPPASSGE